MLAAIALTCNCAWADVTINAETFPDQNFRRAVSAFDTNSDGTLQNNEISAVLSIDVRNSNIASLAGIEVFSSLTGLRCDGNPITEALTLHTFVPYNGILDLIRSSDRIPNIILLNSNGLSVDISASPVFVRYSYNTGLDNVKLIVTSQNDEAKSLASCSNGIFEGMTEGDITTWKGIPYAKQPVGSLRWKAPQAPDDSDEIQEAFNYAPAPIQHESLTNPVELMPRGEECLALNVWNNGKSDTLKPVMVWVHGGAFNSGGTSNPDYEGQNFIEAHNDVILVSVGYRVGMMGFIDFANSGLAGCEDFPDSGNLGLLDILEGVRWVKKNIRAFGGDPQNITLFGNSSGSAAIALIMSMPKAAGVFQKAITESGAVSMTSGVDDCKPMTQGLIEATGATSMSDLMALSSSELLTLAEKLKGATNFPERDGVHLAANLYEAFAQNSPNFTIMAGTMADEVNYWALALGEMFAQFIPVAFYQIVEGISAVNSDDGKIPETFVANYMSEHEGATELEAMCQFVNDLMFRVPTLTELENFAGNKYVYYWTYPSGIPGIGACHTLDIPYVLNCRAVFVPFALNEDFAASVQELWVNFAKSGVPSTSWVKYDTTTRSTMIIDEGFEVKAGHLAERYALVSPLMKYGISGQSLINAANGALVSEGDSGSQPQDDSGTQDTEPQGDSDSQPVENDPGSSGGGCNAGFAVPLLAVTMLFAFRKK